MALDGILLKRHADFAVIFCAAEKLGLPFVSAYLDSVGSDYRHGANFATGGSTIQPIDGRAFEASFSPISLDVQLLQFQQFKARTNELFSNGVKSRLPLPGDFSKALYTFDIGQNDLHIGFKFMTEEQVQASIPNITHQFASVVEVCRLSVFLDGGFLLLSQENKRCCCHTTFITERITRSTTNYIRV